VAEAGLEVGGFSHQGPGEMVFPPEHHRPVAVFFLADDQGERHGKPSPDQFPGHPVSLDHGGAAAFHVRSAKAQHQISLFFVAEAFEVVGHDRVHMTDQHQGNFRFRRQDHQIVAVVVHFLFNDRQSPAFQIAVEVFQDFFLLAGGAVDVEHPAEELAQPGWVNASWRFSHHHPSGSGKWIGRSTFSRGTAAGGGRG